MEDQQVPHDDVDEPQPEAETIVQHAATRPLSFGSKGRGRGKGSAKNPPPSHDPPVEAPLKKQKQLDLNQGEDGIFRQMMATIPNHKDSKEAGWKPYVLIDGSRELAISLAEPFFHHPKPSKVAMDLRGNHLPILISTHKDWLNLDQTEMWTTWFNRKKYTQYSIKSQHNKQLEGPQCSHYIVQWPARWDKIEQRRRPAMYRCLWCDWCDDHFPGRFFLMQQLLPGERYLTEQQNTAALARRYRIPTEDVAEWNIVNRAVPKLMFSNKHS
jgi:hypothetical protein